MKKNLPDSHGIKKRTIMKRLEKNRSTFVYENSTKGLTSPLLTIEKDAVALIIAMSKCRQSLNVSQGVELINSLIKNTRHEKISSAGNDYTVSHH